MDNAEETVAVAPKSPVAEGDAMESPPPVTYALETLLGLESNDIDMGMDVTQIVDVPMDSTLATEAPAPTPAPAVMQDPSVSIVASTIHVKEVTTEAVITAAVKTEAVATEEQSSIMTEEEHPEWEVDSNPISSDSSSDDSSSDEESEDEGDDSYKLLSVEEQAKILMMGEGGSDDEDGSKGSRSAGGQLRTKNELPEEVIPKPSVTITPEMKITSLGAIISMIENTVVVNSDVSGETRRLDSGSVLCLANRTVIGVIAETFGPVPTPYYSVRFTNMTEITEAGLSKGTHIYYSEEHAKYVFPQDLRRLKGTDASNLHDEEVGEGDQEFSDDEAEREHKEKLRMKRGGKMGNGGTGRGGSARPRNGQHAPPSANVALNYDDVEDDGPYKPLTRPSAFASSGASGEAPKAENHGPSPARQNPSQTFRGAGDSQGRGRGRGFDRGRGRGEQHTRGNLGGGHPPYSNQNQPQHPQHGFNNRPQSGDKSTFNPAFASGQGLNQQLRPPSYPSQYLPPAPPQYQYQPPQQMGQLHGQLPPAPPSYPSHYLPLAPPQYQHQPPQQMGQLHAQFPPPPPGWPGAMPQFPAMPGMPPQGAYVNPAFFNPNAGGQNPGVQGQKQNQNGQYNGQYGKGGQNPHPK